jgi:hypothetical protein
MDNQSNVLLYPRPIRRQQNNHTDSPTQQILLLTKILIGCDKNSKPCGLSQTYQIAVLYIAPSFFIGCLD